MKKVLHYVGIMDRGGMETFIMNIYRNLDRTRFQFNFAVHTTKEGDFDSEIIDLGGKMYPFPPYRKNPRQYKMAWRNFFKEHKNEYDVFHFHTNSLANITALMEAKRAKIPCIIVHSHSSYANKGRLQTLNNILHKMHQKKVGSIATNLFACSTEASNWLFGGNSLCGKKVTFIKNGIDLKNFEYSDEKSQNKRNELSISGKTVVGHIGKFVPVKNHKFLTEIIAEMVKLNENTVAIFIGDGPLQNEIKDKAKALGVDKNIMFLGVREDISELLMCMDLFFMPSLYEGLPVSMIEVQATGTPALISDTISKEAKIKENVNFFSIEKTSAEWANKAFEVINAGKNYDNTALANAGYDIKETVKMYERIIGGENIE